MPDPPLLPCDGCGQLVGPVHIARRLARLERTTRFRPIHIQALLLAAVAPDHDASFLYSAEGPFEGEAAAVLASAQIVTAGKSREEVLTEFQKRGLVLIHVLECPVIAGMSRDARARQLESRLPPTLTRIRRSLKPRHILVISPELEPLADKLTPAAVGSPIGWALSPAPFSI